MKTCAITAAALFTALAAGNAQALVLPFSGTVRAIGIVGPDAACAPLLFRGTIAPTAGPSSLGQFSYSHSVCNIGAVGPVVGTFSIVFGNGAIQGNLNGSAAAGASAGLFTPLFNYTILGGTGDYAGASGSFFGTGVIDARNPPSQVNLAFGGSIDAPAIPEPATWGMMVAGFGLAGSALRRRRGPVPVEGVQVA